MSFMSFAEQALSAVASGGGPQQPQDNGVRQTGGQQYNSPYHSQQPQYGYNADEVASHAGVSADDEDHQYVRNAIQHVHSNPDQHQQEVDSGAMAQYGPIIMKALSSAAQSGGSGSGFNMSSLASGLSGGSGNQIMGLVMKEAGNAFASGSLGGGGGGVDKQSLMNGAAMTLTKLVAQKQLSNFIGGSNSGGLGQLMSNFA